MQFNRTSRRRSFRFRKSGDCTIDMSDELHRQSKEHGVSLSEMRFEEAPAAERGTPKAALVQPDIDADLSSAHQRDYSSIPVCCSLPMGFWRRTTICAIAVEWSGAKTFERAQTKRPPRSGFVRRQYGEVNSVSTARRSICNLALNARS